MELRRAEQASALEKQARGCGAISAWHQVAPLAEILREMSLRHLAFRPTVAAMSSHTRKQPTRRICLLAAPEAQILDIAGPLEVFAKANRLAQEQAHSSHPLYDIQVLTTAANRRIACNNGLSLQAHLT